MAISTRRVLSGAVTDVLVLRGNDEVIQSTVNNPGAEFSERGFTRLVNRAEGDDDLATCVGLRPTIPRHLYLKLIAKASETVRTRLEAANPQQADDVPTAVREATRLARSAPSAITKETAIAHALVKSLYEDGRLDEQQVAAFAEAGKFDEANAAIAALANVPLSIAENMMIETRAEGVMILAKVAGMSWSTVKAIINMRDDLSGTEPTDLQACKDTYERLRPSTAQQVLRFHRMQQTAPGVMTASAQSQRSFVRSNALVLSTLDPASAPIAVDQRGGDRVPGRHEQRRIVGAMRAYSVAAKPADNIPAIAPATAGRAGAPWRRPISAAASSGSESSGIAVMQTLELLPINRVIIGSRCGNIISPPIPAASRPAGINSSKAQPRSKASGRDRCRLTAIAEIASASVTDKLQVEERIMHRSHDVGTHAERREEHRRPKPAHAASNASVKTKPTGRARWALSAARVRMS